MKHLAMILLYFVPFAGTAQEQEIQRALIQRDQQSAEFAARIRGMDTSGLEQLHARQLRDAALPLNPDPAIARQLEPYQRQKMADERLLALLAHGGEPRGEVLCRLRRSLRCRRGRRPSRDGGRCARCRRGRYGR